VFRFCRLFGNQYLGFWFIGLLLFAIQEIPYMLMPIIKLNNDPLMNMKESSPTLNIAEKILGSLCIALMSFVVCSDSELFSVSAGRERLFFALATAVLLLNFAGWAIYFSGHQSLFVIVFFLVLMPPLYYIFIGVWRYNIPLVMTGAAFLAVHFTHVLHNLLSER